MLPQQDRLLISFPPTVSLLERYRMRCLRGLFMNLSHGKYEVKPEELLQENIIEMLFSVKSSQEFGSGLLLNFFTGVRSFPSHSRTTKSRHWTETYEKRISKPPTTRIPEALNNSWNSPSDLTVPTRDMLAVLFMVNLQVRHRPAGLTPPAIDVLKFAYSPVRPHRRD